MDGDNGSTDGDDKFISLNPFEKIIVISFLSSILRRWQVGWHWKMSITPKTRQKHCYSLDLQGGNKVPSILFWKLSGLQLPLLPLVHVICKHSILVLKTVMVGCILENFRDFSFSIEHWIKIATRKGVKFWQRRKQIWIQCRISW